MNKLERLENDFACYSSDGVSSDEDDDEDEELKRRKKKCEENKQSDKEEEIQNARAFEYKELFEEPK